MKITNKTKKKKIEGIYTFNEQKVLENDFLYF